MAHVAGGDDDAAAGGGGGVYGVCADDGDDVVMHRVYAAHPGTDLYSQSDPSHCKSRCSRATTRHEKKKSLTLNLYAAPTCNVSWRTF